MSTRTIESRITAHKFGGDCPASWSVLIDNYVFASGLMKVEVPAVRQVAAERLTADDSRRDER